MSKELDEAAEFDRLMALENGEAPLPAAQGETNKADSNVGAEPSETPPAPAAGTEGSEQGGQPAPGAGGEGSGESSSVQPGTPDPDAWLAALPDDVRKRVEDLRNEQAEALRASEDRYKALHGRLAPTQQALSDAQRRLAQLQTPAPAPAAQAATPATPDSFYDSDEWKRWAEDFPGDAKVLRASLDAERTAAQRKLSDLEARVEQLSTRLGQTEQVTSRTVQQTEMEQLAAAHPDWAQISESDQFKGWFDEWRSTQPKSLRDQFYDPERLTQLFNDSEFCIALLDGYKATMQPATPAPATPTPQTDSTQPPVQPPAPRAPDVRMQMATTPEVKGGSPVPQTVRLEDLGDEGKQFDYLWQHS